MARWRHGRLVDQHRRRWSMLVIALAATLCANVFINGVAFLIPTLHSERGLDLAAGRPDLGDAQLRHGGDADRLGLCGRPRRRTFRAGRRLRTDRGRGLRRRVGATRWSPWRRFCSSAAWPQRAATPPAADWWSGGSRRAARTGDGNPADRASRWESAWAPWSSPGSPRATGCRRRCCFPPIVCAAVGADHVRSACWIRRGRRAPRPPKRAGQPVPRLLAVVAHPRGLGAAGRAPGSGVDVHPGVADDRTAAGRPASAGVLVTVAQVLGAGGRIAAGRWSDPIKRSGTLAPASPIRIIAVGRGRVDGACWRSPTGWTRR